MADDMAAEVALTDLEVIQQFSLAVRGASAPRAAVIAALESDLAFLTGSRPAGGRTASRPAAADKPAAPAKRVPTKKAPVKRAARRA